MTLSGTARSYETRGCLKICRADSVFGSWVGADLAASVLAHNKARLKQRSAAVSKAVIVRPRKNIPAQSLGSQAFSRLTVLPTLNSTSTLRGLLDWPSLYSPLIWVPAFHARLEFVDILKSK